MTFLFRTDASTAIGTGHVMRCLALAQAMQDSGADAVFLSSTLTPALEKRLQTEHMRTMTLTAPPYGTEDAKETAEQAKKLGAAWVAMDGYSFKPSYADDLKSHGLHVLQFDDGIPLLRREYRQWQSWTREIRPKARHILITLGGSDPKNVTSKILEAVNAISSSLKISVVVGGSNSHAAEIEKTAKASPHEVTIFKNVSDMASLIAEADIGITNGGTTAYELAFLQLPMIIAVLAENQRPVAAALTKAGCAEEWTGTASLEKLLSDAKKRALMAHTGRVCVDGDGTDRIMMRLLDHRLRLRPVRDEDSELILRLANDPETRSASFSTAPITPEEHRAWFTKKLQEKTTTFLLAIDAEDQPVGSIRFEEKPEVTLSFSLAPEHRGKGLGTELVRLGTEKYLRAHPKGIVHAWVKSANDGSASIFRKIGFQELSPEGDVLHFSVDSSRIPS
ncbi:GNAT family N-acetyltransferase [Candidatus Peribacteria bacterium]|nr:GNAT family N-acetyltransferase [Candidatus Peribacteria bacterium]